MELKRATKDLSIDFDELKNFAAAGGQEAVLANTFFIPSGTGMFTSLQVPRDPARGLGTNGSYPVQSHPRPRSWFYFRHREAAALFTFENEKESRV